MLRTMLCFALVLTSLSCFSSPAQAQLIQRLRARRAAGETPFLDRAALLSRRIRGRVAGEDLVPQPEPEPTPAQTAQASAARNAGFPGSANAAVRIPARGPVLSTADLESFDGTALRQALDRTAFWFNNQLAHFSSAKSWQGYLALPASASGQHPLDPADLEQLLGRFDRVAANEKYSQVSSLESFDQMHSILSEMSNRLNGPVLGNPAVGNPTESTLDSSVAAASFDESPQERDHPEALPKPAPEVRLSSGEHSILVRPSQR